MGGIAKYVLWMVLVVAMCVALAWTVRWARRRFLSDEEPGGGPVFTLAELRSLHARGELTDAEYEHVRQHLLKAQDTPLNNPQDALLLERLRAARRQRQEHGDQPPDGA